MNIRVLVGTIVFFASAVQTVAQTPEQRVVVKVEPSFSIEQRVANDMKEKQLRKEAEERLAAEESMRIANTRPESVLSRGRTLYIDSDTSFFEEAQLQNALSKKPEFKSWDLAVIEGWEGRRVADLLICIDRPLFTYTFTYQILDRPTGKVVASGKVTAFDGNLAAPKLAAKIIEDIKKAKQTTSAVKGTGK